LKLKRPELVGELHNRICQKMRKIFLTQKEMGVSNGIKGFLLYGPPGTGKTTIAQTVIVDIIREIGAEHLPAEQLYKLLNLADIARSRFGETENIIRDMFDSAMKRAKDNGVFYIVVMDDVDGMFPTRSYHRLDAWYLGHLNVLFTELDKLESDKVGVIMTTNRRDLLDDAVVSRLVAYKVPSIDLETARMKVENRIKELKMAPKYLDIILERIQKKVQKEEIKNLSFREVEKELIFAYLEWIESK